MSSATEDFNILNLPLDVIRNIIKLGVEDVDTMRLISPMWNELSIKHLSNWKHLPAIRTVRWSSNSDSTVQFYIRIEERFQKYFGLATWQSRSIPNKSLCEYSVVVIGQNQSTCANGLLSLSDRLSLIFNRCSRIGKLHLRMHIFSSTDEIEAVKCFMNEMLIDVISFTTIYFERTGFTIFDVLDGCQANRLVYITSPYTENFITFRAVLLHFLRLVSTVELISRESDEDYVVDQDRRLPNQQQLVQILQVLEMAQQLQQQQHQRDQNERVAWERFKDSLNGSGQFTATIQEEPTSSGRVECRLIVAAKAE